MHLLIALSLSFCSPKAGPVVPDGSSELVVGIASDWDATTATLYRFERKPAKGKKAPGRWKAVGKAWDATIGRKGLAAGRGLLDWCGPESERKVEGDWKAPAGLFRIGGMYGYGDALKKAPKGRLTPMTDATTCISDPASRYYNRIVDPGDVEPDWRWGGGPLKRGDNRKSRSIMIGVNGGADPEHDPPVPGQGSCVLFHIVGPHHRTVGCTALDVDEIDALIAWLRPKAKPVYLLVTKAQYAELAKRKGSGLPALP